MGAHLDRVADFAERSRLARLDLERVIHLAHKHGESQAGIARASGMSRAWVADVIRRHDAQR